MWARLVLARRLARPGMLSVLRETESTPFTRPHTVAGGLVLGSLLVAGVAIGGIASAAAQPPDYAPLPVDPNVATDSTAYLAAPTVINPDGQPGVQAVFTHRDGTRQISDTIVVLADSAEATAALQQNQSSLGAVVSNGAVQQVPVGADGTLISGTSPGGVQSISVLLFTQGNAFVRVEFTASPNDPAPTDLVIDYAQRQANAIQQQLGM